MPTEHERELSRERNRRYREAHPDRVKASKKKHYENNKDKVRAANKRWKDANKEHRKEVNRIWEANNIEKRREYSRRQYHRRPEWYAAYCRNKYLDLVHWSWEDVEGFDGWTNNTEVHHRWEGLGYSRDELIAMGKYYNLRAAELICLSKSEHRRLHNQIKKDIAR